jgi:hypothetical protein
MCLCVVVFVFVYMCTEENIKEKKGFRQIPGCWSYASPPRIQQKKRTRKRGKKNAHQISGCCIASRKICIVSGGEKKKGEQEVPSLGALIICKATPLCLLFFQKKRLTPSLGSVIICNATSLCLLAAHVPTLVEIVVPQLPVPAQPVVGLCNNKKQKLKCKEEKYK